jgi:plastocyanin
MTEADGGGGMRSDGGERRGGFTTLAFWASGALIGAVLVGVGIVAFLGDAYSRSALKAPPVVVRGHSTTVRVDDNRFVPQHLRVLADTVITWELVGDTTHNIRADQDAFESATMSEGAVSYTFTRTGEYFYRCTLHPRMNGVVVVEDAATSAP